MTKEQIIHIFKSFEHDAHFGTYLCSIPDTEYDDVADEILRLFSVMPSLPVEKLKQIRRIADDVYHDLVSSNHPTHDEWCSSPKNLRIIMSIVDKLLGNEA